MHRSGTSAMARVVNLLGADIGNDLLPAATDNPKGFWENRKILRIHENLLKDLGSIYDDVRPLPTGWLTSEPALRAQAEILAVLKEDFGESDLWCLKEPRMCRLIRLWLPLFPELGCSPHFLIAFRHPFEVAASLERRNKIAPLKSMMWWLDHVLEAEETTRGYRRAFASMSGLLSDWRLTMKRVSETLQIEWPVAPEDAKEAVEEFLDIGLRHHEDTREVRTTDPDSPDWVDRAYHALKVAEETCGEPDLGFFDELKEHLREQRGSLLARVYEQDIAQRLTRIGEHSSQLSQARERLKERDQQLRTKNEQIAQKNRLIVEKNQLLQQKNQQILEKNREIAEKNQLLVQKSLQIAQKDQKLTQKDRLIARNEARLLAMRTTRVWRAACLFRRFRQWVRLVIRYPSLLLHVRGPLREEFDGPYYLAHNPDVADMGLNPLLHYLFDGAKEGRNPRAGFNTADYLKANPELEKTGTNPFLHYVLIQRSGRGSPGDGTA
jgi:hypothetical protein